MRQHRQVAQLHRESETHSDAIADAYADAIDYTVVSDADAGADDRIPS